MARKRRVLRVLAAFLVALGLPLIIVWFTMIRLPGRSFDGPLPPLTPEQVALRDELSRDLSVLAVEIGERHVDQPEALERAAAFLEESLGEAGYDVRRQTYRVGDVDCRNLEVEIEGVQQPGEIVVVGAHYDSVPGCPAANDNGTGVVATLALARAFRETLPSRTLRFVLFVNEEPPYFQTSAMGSRVYAGRVKEREETIHAMLSLETIGHFSDERGSQAYPPPLSLAYPSTGNFIGFVGNLGSRELVRRVVGSFREHASFPSEGAALPGWLPGVSWSDHWSFFRDGHPAVMVTDTAPFRYPHYHEPTDTIDKIDFDGLTRVVSGLVPVIRELSGEGR